MISTESRPNTRFLGTTRMRQQWSPGRPGYEAITARDRFSKSATDKKGLIGTYCAGGPILPSFSHRLG